jgi:hypothetical protein
VNGLDAYSADVGSLGGARDAKAPERDRADRRGTNAFLLPTDPVSSPLVGMS